MQTHLFYIVLLGIASGIFVRSLFDLEQIIVVFTLVLTIALAVLWRHAGQWQMLYASAALLALSLGMARMDFAIAGSVSSTLAAHAGSEMLLTGIVSREPDIRTHTQHLYVSLTDTEQVILVIADRYQSVSYGDVLQVVGRLEEPQSFTTDLGRTFNYAGYLQAQGVSYLVRYPDSIIVTDQNQGNRFVAMLLSLKALFQDSVRQYIPSPQIGLAEGLLLGEKQALGEQWNELFRKTGIIHIVVLSGYNVMLVIGFFVFVLSYFCSLRTRVLGALFGVICFALIVGLSATVVRASVMASLLLLAVYLGRTYAIMRALVLAGVIMLLINPYLLVYDPGFQLSFLATLGLIVVAPYFESMLVMDGPVVRVRDYVIATVATQLAVSPLLLYQIGEWSLVAVLVNVLVLPVVPAAMLLTFVTGITGFVSSSLAAAFGWLTYWSLQYILWLVAFIGSWPLAAVTVPSFSAWWVLIAYVCMGYVWYRFQTQTITAAAEALTIESVFLHDDQPDVHDWEIVEVITNQPGTMRRIVPGSPRNIFIP